MHILSKLTLLLASTITAQSALAHNTVIHCGKMLDIKAGVWRERVSITIENNSVKYIV